ncbi:four-carbon acid sugar kinase family protein [Ancrocorticia populi]|uniref:Hydroxyacid dehydrogenase n=1 Tax=Ancrocorticia populi TaxID=2175228 RepID=A0A2V1KBR8_9ACTO|nr:four-carbon acid sugar kinase family protein [Ancrocorticia populi]PWF27171.1 hypothetical protein DD236_01860 [Ancrocorticia populi]
MSQTLVEIEQGIAAGAPISAEDVRAAQARRSQQDILVVLDDDPTGTQSVADLPILTSWEVDDFLWALQDNPAAIYVLTNSRSLAPDNAAKINREVIAAANSASETAGVKPRFVSRSDSTLRGHFPLETDTIVEELSQLDVQVNGVVLVPAFSQAGRITVNGVHYAGSDEEGYVPVAQTEFSQDATFGYHNSFLPSWVEEKTGGKVTAESVLVIDLQALRTDRSGVVSELLASSDRRAIVCDCTCENDLRHLALALIEAEEQGARFIYRVGPPFVRAMIGQEVREPLTPQEIPTPTPSQEVAHGGLVVVGSHVSLTTKQVTKLKEDVSAQSVEIDVEKAISRDLRNEYLDSIVTSVVNGLRNGTTILATSRTLVRGIDETDSLRIARDVSSFVTDVVQRVTAIVRPIFVIAKGGITSSDVATKGLAISRATVIGPMLPGIVSLWRPEEGPAAGIPFIVFAGNVGNEDSMVQVVQKLIAAAHDS